MQRRLLFFSFLALAFAAVLGFADRASAAIRITLSDGTNEKVFYSTSSRTALFSTDLGDYEVLLQTTLSNFPGLATGGTLTQTVNVSDEIISGSSLPTLSITSAVIDAVAGLTTGFVTDADQRAAVLSSPLARFTLPSGANLDVSSRSGAVASVGPTTGSVQNHTEVNGEIVSSLPQTVNSGANGVVTDTVANPTNQYTLSSQVVLTGASPGVTGLAITATSGVTAAATAGTVPEPASMVIWSLGGLGLAIAGAARYRRRPVSVT
jgi:hypothetical protein